jgi:ribosomal protein L11 methyltransferase
MRAYPAIEAAIDPDRDQELLELVVAEIEDEQPLGVEFLWPGVRITFVETARRDRALARLQARWAAVGANAVDVIDEDWATTSQNHLSAIVVGEYTVSPPWDLPADPRTPCVVIQPSMGFGTGHHASTRLCMRLMLDLPEPSRRAVLDVGTGSGLLAIVAAQTGAERVVAIDVDPDALVAARENLELNGMAGRIDLRLADITDAAALAGERFALVIANLTGAMIVREASRLAGLVAAGGRLIASGFQMDERDDVRAALTDAGLAPVAQREEDGWAGLTAIPNASRAR